VKSFEKASEEVFPSERADKEEWRKLTKGEAKKAETPSKQKD